MAEQDDMSGDLSLVDHNRLQERIRMSKKQRSMQLKAYEQNEKRMAKQQLSADKKLFNKRSKKAGAGVDSGSARNSKIIFGDGVLMMDVIARKDISECKRFLTLMVAFSHVHIIIVSIYFQKCNVLRCWLLRVKFLLILHFTDGCIKMYVEPGLQYTRCSLGPVVC